MAVLIHAFNAAVLVLVVVGLPEATSLDLGTWSLNAREGAAQLLFWMLLAVGLANLTAAGCWKRKPRNQTKAARKACLQWALVYAVLFAALCLHQAGHLSFQWLKDLLRR